MNCFFEFVRTCVYQLFEMFCERQEREGDMRGRRERTQEKVRLAGTENGGERQELERGREREREAEEREESAMATLPVCCLSSFSK